MAQERTAGVESARRALSILLMFREDNLEVTVEDVIEEFQISQTSAYRYLSLLRELHFVQLRERGKYVLGPRINQLTAASEDVVDLEEVVTPTLRRLSELTDETAFVMRRVRNEASFVTSWEPNRSLALSFRPGTPSPLHRGAVAKILLAYASREIQRRYLDRFVPEPNERERIEADLQTIRNCGYAESSSEVDEGIWGGAVPVFVDGHVIASLSVAGPEFRIPEEKRVETLEQLRVAATQLSEDLQAESGRDESDSVSTSGVLV